MDDFDALGQKIKGKAQKVKGQIQQDTSDRNDFGGKIKGGISKAKGEINDKVADLKIKNDRNNKDIILNTDANDSLIDRDEI